MNIRVALNTCERVLDALRTYEERDAAIDALAREIEGMRTALLDLLYGVPAADDPITHERTAVA